MKNQERILNAYIAEVIDGMRDGWSARPEVLGAFRSRKIPDILITEAGKPPIVIETEVEPARGLQGDAVRKTSEITANGERVRAVISAVIPDRFRAEDSAENIREGLRSSKFSYKTRMAADDEDADDEEFPTSGFLVGSLEDIATTVQLINAATRDLDKHVREAAAVIRGAAEGVPAPRARAIARLLRQEEGSQTTQMAMAILLNAFIFQEVLSSIDFGYRTVSPTEHNRNGDGHVSISKTARAWRRILDINYYPIFAMAIKIIEEVPKNAAHLVVDVVAEGADGIVRLVAGAQDVASSVFQSLIADQKILAAFYTRPETAVMIAETVYPPDPDECGRATIADFACGTGILLHAVYRRLGQAYEAAAPAAPAAPANGGNPTGGGGVDGNGRNSPPSPARRMVSRHRDMMENKIIGCDVLPSHVHLTASSLAGLHVCERFEQTRLYIMPYGAIEGFDARAKAYDAATEGIKEIRAQVKSLRNMAKNESGRKRAAMDKKIKAGLAKAKAAKERAAHDNPIGHVRCGSIEMLDFTQTSLDAFDIASRSIIAASGEGADAPVSSMDIRRGSCDIVVMNPPFSSAANPEQKDDDVHNPAFAGFDATPRAQKAMGDRAAAIAAGKITSASSGRRRGRKDGREKITAGGKLPVYFAYIADMMLRDGGELALVLPLAFAQGESWRPLREKILRDYDDILVVSAAGHTADESSFSAATGMREIVLMARKAPDSGPSKRVTYVVLKRVPRDPLMGMEVGRLIRSLRGKPVPDILDGPGPMPLRVGRDEAGSAISAAASAGDKSSFTFNAVLDMSLAVRAIKLGAGSLVLRHGAKPVGIPMTTMDSIGEGGLLARDIDGTEVVGGRPRGPFDFAEKTSDKRYPGVKKHDKDVQSAMTMEASGYYIPKDGVDAEQVHEAWGQAGRVLIATHWQFNAQPCVSGYFKKAVLGGSAFPNFNLRRAAHEKPFVVWQNSVFGALCFWLHSTRQQIGRGIVSKDLRKTMPVLNLGALGKDKLKAVTALFGKYGDKAFKSLENLPDDADRLAMDMELFGILAGRKPSDDDRDAIKDLYAALAAEPTIRGDGGKKTRG